MSNKTLSQRNAEEVSKTPQLDVLINKKYKDFTHRVFPPQAFLFKANQEEKRYSEQKYSYATLNSFKQKLEKASFVESTAFNKRYESKMTEGDKSTEKKESKNEKIIESQNAKLSQQQKVHFSRKPIQQRKRSKDPFSLKNFITKSDQPLTQHKISVFPKQSLKSMFSKNKVNPQANRELFNELGYRMKKTLSVKLQDIDAKLNQMTSQNVLQLMTIFSIKEHKQPKPKQEIEKKRSLFQSLIPEKQRIVRYKKKKFQENEVQIDINTDKIYFKKIYAYLYFLTKVNLSNGLSLKNITLNQRYSNEKVQVFVGNGNNKYLIIALLRRRFWLEISSKITKNTKFIWTQNSIKEAHEFQQNKRMVIKKKAKTQNYCENAAAECQIQNQIQPKDGLNLQKNILKEGEDKKEKTLQQVKNDQKLQVFKIRENVNPTKIQNSKYNKKLFINEKVSQTAQKALKSFKVNTKSKTAEFTTSNIHTITNHVPHNSFIGSKKALFYTMQHYYRQIKNIDPFTIIPKTYHFKALDDQAYNRFLEEQKQSNQKSIWIVKPGECSNRGNGISLMKAAEITRKLLKKQFHQNGQPKTTIVQSYITDPLLYCGRKFDIRHYLMITVVNGNLKAYWYSQGYLRTSSEYFTLENLNNPFVHLTNDAIQKNSEKYGKFEPGNKLSYHEFQRYLDNAHTKSRVNFRQQILPLMKEIATDVVRANYLNIDKERKMNNFEIFGMDFMIDNKFKPWLIEINANPCLQISCHLLSRIIPIMVQHSLRLGLDPLIPPPSHYPTINRYYLPDNFLQNLRYEIIFDENEESCKLQNRMELSYDFQFDEPQDEYENEGTEIDLNKVLD